MPNDILNGDISNILNFLSAAAALGTAAMGLVDSTKAFNGGPSNFGFGDIKSAISPFLVQAPGGAAAFGSAKILQTLKANWLNGVATADQKAKAKSLIHLGLTQGNAAALAAAAGVNGELLTAAAQNIASGTALTPSQVGVLGQFDAVLGAVLDAAYERGDQKYRNWSKLLAMVVATVLGGLGGWLVYGRMEPAWQYLSSWQFGISLLIGISATPLAPIAKDLATSLQTAVSAVRTIQR